MAKTETFLTSTDEEKVAELLEETKSNSVYFENLVNKIVKDFSSDLDSLMTDLYRELTQENAISTDLVERYYAELTNLLYFMAERVEKLNVYGDMAKSAAKEIYNKAYLSASSEKDEKGKSVRTIAENTSIAETKAQYEGVVGQVYEHAYKSVKYKIDAANEMVTTLKYILKKRVSDDYINKELSGNNATLKEIGRVM